MYEIHGWFVLSPAVDDDLYDDADLDREAAMIRPFVDAVAAAGSVDARLLVLNGEYIVSLHAAPNRWRPELDSLDTLIDHIGERLPGSYGTLFEWSDDPADLPDVDGFHLRVMTRGRVTRRPDTLLSPRVPVIEE